MDELRAAVGTGTRWRGLADGLPPHARVAGLALLPVVGSIVGAAAAVAAALGAMVAPAAGVVAALVVLEGAAARRRTRTGALAAVAKAGALAVLPAPARIAALVLAPTLARWAVVVQCYGGQPASSTGASPLVGRARFREFGVASLVAIGGALVTLDALGLLAVLATALVTIVLRLLAYRDASGLTQSLLARTETVVEAVVLVVIAGVVAAMRPTA